MSTVSITAPHFDAAVIAAAAVEQGHSLGWRFMMSPPYVASKAKLLMVFLNPGGSEDDLQHSKWAPEEGNCYRTERWLTHEEGKAPLQLQVQKLWKLLGLEDDEVFCANYVPFRSESWQKMGCRRKSAEAFAHQLWSWLLPQLSYERVVCVGKDLPGRAIAKLLGAGTPESLPVGWGKVVADRYRLPNGKTLIALPHLSRFQIFGRAEGTGIAELRTLFELEPTPA